MKLIALLSLLGLATSFADPLRLTDLNTKSPWIAHLDAASLRTSPLQTFLEETAGFDQFLKLKNSLKEKLSLDLDTIDGVTLLGSGDQWKDTSILIRGNFGGNNFETLPAIDHQTGNDSPLIRKGPLFQKSHLFLTKLNAKELVVGTSPQAVRDGLKILSRTNTPSWGTADLNDHARSKLATATALFAIDMKTIGAELKFEAELTRAMRSAWFLIDSKGDDIEITFLINSTDSKGLTFLSERWTLFSAMLLSGQETPQAVRQSMTAQKVEMHDHWMTITMVAPPKDAGQFLEALAPLFADDSTKVTAPE